MILYSLIAMINKKYLKLIRCSDRKFRDNFLYDKISERIIDSIDLINVPFHNILEVGVNDQKILNYLLIKYPNSNYFMADICKNKLVREKKGKFVKFDIENPTFEKNKYDLIYSNFFMNLSDNYKVFFKNIYDSLNTNGFLIATIPNQDNIFQLVNSMYTTDLQLYNGAYKRFNPTFQIEEILKIFKEFKFNEPLIRLDKIQIEYENFSKLINDLRATRLSYCYQDKKKTLENKRYINYLIENYKKKYYNGKYILDIKFNIISAWKN